MFHTRGIQDQTRVISSSYAGLVVDKERQNKVGKYEEIIKLHRQTLKVLQTWMLSSPSTGRIMFLALHLKRGNFEKVMILKKQHKIHFSLSSWQ